MPAITQPVAGLNESQRLRLHNVLEEIGLTTETSQTEQLLIANEFDLESLAVCSEEDLRQIGIVTGPRVRIMQWQLSGAPEAHHMKDVNQLLSFMD